MKKIIFLFLALMACSTEDFSQGETLVSHLDASVVTKPVPINYRFDDNAKYWFALEDTLKYQHLVKMIRISNGAFKITIKDSVRNDREFMDKVSLRLISIKSCVDTFSLFYLKDFENDVTMGSVIVNCMIKNHLTDE